MVKISIARDFSKNPGARHNEDGNHSGEAFFNNILLPKFEEAEKSDVKLEVDLNGLYGFPSSFVSESFGKLSILKGADQVNARIVFVSDENPIRAEKAKAEIKNPRKDEQ